MSALLQSVLESRGHAVTAVADGESGWESYQSRHFSMVILEWLLPEMDGLEVCRKIRSSPKGEDSLILVITLRTNPGDLKQILAAGADDYLAQPVDRLLLNIRLEIAEQRASRLMHQRKAEKGRGQVQAMLKLVLDTIPSRVFWKNKESRYLGCNRLFALDAGLQDPSQIVGKTDRDLRWAEQAQLYISDDLAVMQSGLPKVNYEEHQTSPDGESMYLEASKIPLKDGKGNLIGVLGTYQDITERKRAETELFAAQSNLAATLDALPDLLFELGLDGRYYDYHSSRPELLAAPPEALIGKTVHDILPPEAADVVMLALREADETGHSHGRQIELQVPQGKLWFELSIARKPVAAGLAPRFIVLLRDITVRKRAEAEILALNLSLEEQVQERTKELLAKEEQLRETLALNDSILMTSPMGIAAYRQDGQCVMANPSLASIADITQEQLLKQNFRQLSSWQASGIQEAAERVLATGARVELEIRHLTSFFGHDVWARCWLSRFTSRGEPHLLLMLENITEKKAAEEELRLAASVYQNSSEGILVTDAAGIILSVNPAFTEITGYAEDEALGRKTSLLRSDRHGPEFYRSMWEALTKEGCWRGEVWNRR
ncbi:MAG: PAS domain-containing protein, partial [Gammaproteobacteria bacterium]|nr:PAS domain-containing protein [Gammaproteobacteria bacterium]